MSGATATKTPTTRGVCEVVAVEDGELRRTCEQPATMRYPSMGGGYMRLCDEHGAKHARYCQRWDGEKWIIPDGVAEWARE